MTSNQKRSSAVARPASAGSHGAPRAHQLRQLLAEVRSQETQWVRTIRERSPMESSTIGDEGDTAQSGESFELTASLAALAGTRAAAVESALERLRQGSYGVCEECEEEIPLDRLQAMPWTVLCVDCQRQRERLVASKQAETSALWVVPNEPASIGSDQLDPDGESGSAQRGDSAPRRRRGRPRSRPAAA